MIRMKTPTKIIFYLILIVVSVIMVFPFFWMIMTSLKGMDDTFRIPLQIFPTVWRFENYPEAWSKMPFARFYLNSITVSAALTVGQILTCSLAAYAFARLNFKGREKLFLLYLSTIMIPFQSIMVPVFLIVQKMGMVDTLWALIIPLLFSPYGTFLLRQSFKTVPMELEESIRMDGGTSWTCYRKIIMPLNKPALAAFGTFVFVWSWNNFQWPLLVINKLERSTLPLGINFFIGQNRTQWNYTMVASTVVLMPLIIVYLFAQKYFVEGITLSGMKG